MARPKNSRPAPAKPLEQAEPPRRPRLPQAADEPRRNLRPWLLGSGGVILLVAFIVFLAVGLTGEVGGIPDGVEQVAVGSRLHVDGPIDYDGVPAGGDHAPIWLNCGFYPQPVPPENAVHALEHGAVWVTFDTNAGHDVANSLAVHARNPKVIVSPVVDQGVPVLVTAWGRQMEVTDPNDSRIDQFIVAFSGAGGIAPEPGAACSGGIGSPA